MTSICYRKIGKRYHNFSLLQATHTSGIPMCLMMRIRMDGPYLITLFFKPMWYWKEQRNLHPQPMNQQVGATFGAQHCFTEPTPSRHYWNSFQSRITQTTRPRIPGSSSV